MHHIRDCFNKKFSKICKQAQNLNELTAIVKHYLPEFLHLHCRVTSFQNGCLILVTSNAAWASQLRYVLPDLRDQLRAEEKWYQLTSIKIVINTDSPIPTTTVENHTSPSKPSPWRTILHSLASSQSE